MLNTSWIKLHRKLIDSLVFQNEKCLKVWIWCLCKAGYKEKEVLFGKKKIELKRGQFIMGGFTAEETLHIARTTIYYWLDFLEKEGMVDIKKTNKYTVITIRNWDAYQEVDNKRTSKKHQITQQMDIKWTSKRHKQELKELEELKESFNQFWNLYDKKRGKEKAFLYWCKLTDEERAKVFENVPIYVRATEKQFRKDPERYLRNKTFNDEVIDGAIKQHTSKGSVQSRLDYKFDPDKAKKRIEELEKLGFS